MFGKPRAVGLRATPVNTSGNAVTQTLWNAYRTVALRCFPAPGGGEVGLLVVDEAHFAKNPWTKRPQAVALRAERCGRALS